MDPIAYASVGAVGLPRTRGDGPATRAGFDFTCTASPHTRGWTPSPTCCMTPRCRLPRTRGDGPSLRLAEVHLGATASPHTRGWTPDADRGIHRPYGGFPAHAGMDPRISTDRGSVGFPAHAGMDPILRQQLPSLSSVGGFPAHAGMDP